MIMLIDILVMNKHDQQHTFVYLLLSLPNSEKVTYYG